jgi:hypothetical protein
MVHLAQQDILLGEGRLQLGGARLDLHRQLVAMTLHCMRATGGDPHQHRRQQREGRRDQHPGEPLVDDPAQREPVDRVERQIADAREGIDALDPV